VTDKVKTYGHDYIPGYVDLFETRRHSVKKMLEIGIGLGPHYELFSSVLENYTMGGGLKMWRDYFSCAHIYAMDIYECPMLDPRITTFVGDQSNEKDLLHIVEIMGGELEIVVDDGSHFGPHQVFSFMVLAKYMVQGGIYVIEDVLAGNIDSFQTLAIFPQDFQEYIRQHFDIKWYDTRGEGRPDNDFLMVFIRQ
jgi:hypothetical protein